MNRKLQMLAAAFVLSAGLSVSAQTATYHIDPAHSTVNFSIRHMAISTVHGRFGVQSGTILLDAANPEHSSVTAVIDIASVDTGVAQRDGHLKSPDFFDAAKYPTATFKSSSVKRTGDGYDVLGDLTLHGVTKALTFHMDAPTKEQIGMDNKAHRGFSATTVIHRQDFGLTWNGTLKSGDNVLGDDVKLDLEVEAGQ